MDSIRRTPSVWRPLKVNYHLFRHGFGNWAEIADFIGTNKSREDVEEHYLTVYLDTPDFLPVNIMKLRLLILYPKETDKAN